MCKEMMHTPSLPLYTNIKLICFLSRSFDCGQNQLLAAAHDLERKELIVKRGRKREKKSGEEDGKVGL